MKLSVIIPCRNEVNFIEECIEAIYSNDLSSSCELNVVIVDGLSDDGTRDKIKSLSSRFPNLFLIDNKFHY